MLYTLLKHENSKLIRQDNHTKLFAAVINEVVTFLTV